MTKKDLFRKENFLDLYRYARFTYRHGIETINNKQFDKLEKLIKVLYKNNPMLIRTYDDDFDIPMDLIEKYNLDFNIKIINPKQGDNLLINNPYYTDFRDLLESNPTKSIESIFNEKEVYTRLLRMPDVDLIFSLKVDGISTRTGICLEDINWKQAISLSRARKGDPFDFTKNISRVFPKNFKLPEDLDNKFKAEIGDKSVPFKFVYGEAYVVKSALPYLRKKYARFSEWKSSRSTAMSILRVDLKDESDYNFLKLKVFKVSDLTGVQSDDLTIAKEAGFDVVPWEVVNKVDIPLGSFNSFKIWLDKLQERFNHLSLNLDIESDGIVCEINDQTKFKLMGGSNQYNSGNFAIKTGYWGNVKYKGIVDYLDFKDNETKYSVVAVIKPVIIKNGNEVKRVNCFNPAIVVSNDIVTGKEIEFEAKADGSFALVYNK